MDSTPRRIAFNAIISAGARVIGTALALIIVALLTRYLGQAGFGHYVTILAFVYIFSVVADMGLYSITVREISREGADEQKIASNAFTLRLVSGLLAFGAGAVLSLFLPYPSILKAGIALGALGFWFLSNCQVLMGVFQKYLKMTRPALAELVGRAAQLSLVTFFIWRDWGFLSVVSALVVGALVNFFLVYRFCQKFIKIKLRFDFDYWGELLKDSIPLGIAAVLVMIYFKLDTVMLSLMKGPIAVGIYGLAYKILESLIFFPSLIVGLVMPLLARFAFTSWSRFNRVIQRTLEVLLLFIFPLIIGTIFLSPAIIKLIGGGNFTASAGVLNLLIIATGIIFLGALFSNVIIALRKQKALVWIYGVGAVVNVGANFIFIPRYSYWGAAGTTIFTEALVTILMVAIIYKVLGHFFSFRLLVKIILATLAMGGFLWFNSTWHPFILGLAGIVVYFGVLYLIKGISKEDLAKLTRPAFEERRGKKEA